MTLNQFSGGGRSTVDSVGPAVVLASSGRYQSSGTKRKEKEGGWDLQSWFGGDSMIGHLE